VKERNVVESIAIHEARRKCPVSFSLIDVRHPGLPFVVSGIRTFSGLDPILGDGVHLARPTNTTDSTNGQVLIHGQGLTLQLDADEEVEVLVFGR